MLRQSDQKDRELHRVKINSGLTAKKLKITRGLKFFRSVTDVTLRFFSVAALALRIFFSSSESEARSSVSYSWTTSQPSLFLSAIFINFWRFLMISFASATNLWIPAGLPVLSSICVNILSNRAFTSNCFRLPLYLMSAASLSDFALRSNCFPFSCNCEVRQPLKSEKTSSTNSEFEEEFWDTTSA